MKRIASAVIALGLLAIAALVVPGLQAGGKGGELVFSTDAVDLGRVPLDAPAPYRFEMRNVGDKPVRILGTPKITAVEGC